MYFSIRLYKNSGESTLSCIPLRNHHFAIRTRLLAVKPHQKTNFLRLLQILAATALFIFAINFAGYSFKVAGGEITKTILSVTYNPFISLFIGLLATAIIHSSSTTTSIIVAAVAAGTIEFTSAVPMIMGANIGTTITSTLVSIGYLNKRQEFRRAIAAGTQHDIFNILVTLILFPLELYYGALSSLSYWITDFIVPFENSDSATSFSYGLWGSNSIFRWFFSATDNTVIPLITAFIVLIVAVKLFSNLLYNTLYGSFKDKLQRLIFSSPLRAFLWGMGLTATVQSSSVTTPLVVPLVATRKVSLKSSFPYILGANIGTTFTALFAALFHSSEAISIAIVHVLFNLIGVLLFFPVNVLRQIPIKLASLLGFATIRNRFFGFIYILITFFLLPFLLIYFTQENQ